jgi:hypothetical protein
MPGLRPAAGRNPGPWWGCKALEFVPARWPAGTQRGCITLHTPWRQPLQAAPPIAHPSLPPSSPRTATSAPGCADDQCALCQHSTARRCASPFDSKYLVGDTLAARCGAGVRVELVDRATGAPFEGDLPGVSLEVVVLDGNAFSARYQGEAARWAARRVARGRRCLGGGGPCVRAWFTGVLVRAACAPC